MPKHKLFCDSAQSPELNLSVEKRENEPVSPDFEVQSGKKAMLEVKNYGENVELCSSQNSSKSDDSMEEKSFFLGFLEKRPYSFDEDVEILNFVLKDQNIFRVSSILLWKYLEVKKQNPKRTYQSLKNRFLRYIKPKLFTTYRHLIKNEEQIKNILNKFPELKREIRIKEPLLFESLRKENDEFTEETVPKIISVGTSSSHKLSVSAEEDFDVFVPQTGKPAVNEKTKKREVKLFNDSLFVTVPRNMIPSSPLFDGVGIYQKFLNCKAKNKLIPCSACGRCGSPEVELTQIQDSENDIIIPNSIGNSNSQSRASARSSTRKAK